MSLFSPGILFQCLKVYTFSAKKKKEDSHFFLNNLSLFLNIFLNFSLTSFLTTVYHFFDNFQLQVLHDILCKKASKTPYNQFCVILVLALAVNGSCMAPIDIQKHIYVDGNADKTEQSREETEEDQYDINEKMINEGLSLDDTGIQRHFP